MALPRYYGTFSPVLNVFARPEQYEAQGRAESAGQAGYAAAIDVASLERESREKMFYDSLDWQKESWGKQFEAAESHWDDQLAQWEREFGLRERSLEMQEEQQDWLQDYQDKALAGTQEFQNAQLGLQRSVAEWEQGFKTSQFDWEKGSVPRMMTYLDQLMALRGGGQANMGNTMNYSAKTSPNAGGGAGTPSASTPSKSAFAADHDNYSGDSWATIFRPNAYYGNAITGTEGEYNWSSGNPAIPEDFWGSSYGAEADQYFDDTDYFGMT
uniref:Uncharacterized protein n=1 Tax=viral metagenome TaxID=1070528 RepID=A0A6H1ZN48_9ZZZZ